MDDDFDIAAELNNLLRLDHERSIAKWQGLADEAAAEGNDEQREFFQGLADRYRARKLPWEEGYHEQWRRAS